MILWKFADRYGRRYLRWYIGGALALAATNALSVTIPLHLASGIDAFGRGGDGKSEVIWAAAVVVIMGAAIIAIRTASRVLFFNPGRLIEAEITRDLFTSLLASQPDLFAKHTQGDLTSRFTSDVQTVRLLFGFTALGLFNTAAAAIFVGLQLARLSPTFGLLAAIPLLVGFTFAFLGVQRMRVYMREYQELYGVLSEAVLASFQGISAIHTFGAAGALSAQLEVTNQALARNVISRSWLRVAVGPVLSLATALSGFCVLWFAGREAIFRAGALSSGEIVALLSLLAYLAAPLRGLTFTLAVLRQASVSLQRLDQILSAVPHRPDKALGAIIPGQQPPAITARALSYRYPGSDRDALHDISFELPSGGLLGIYGATGSGKSTLVRCLLRLCDPPEGALFIDGTDIRALDLDAWRERAAIVPQRAFLWSGTVRENILLGRDAGALDALVSAAQLGPDIRALPSGVDTVVGEAGITLSGGQRQRVAIARGLARPALLFVLDDVLSAVDHATEAALSDVLAKRDATTVIVSNRTGVLHDASLILVLQEGRLIDAGTHEALMSRDNPYRDAALREQEESHRGEVEHVRAS